MKRFIIIALFLLLATSGLFAYFTTATGPLQQTKTIYIEKGSGFRKIVQQLQDEGVVHHAYLVAVPALLYEKQAMFKPGEYAFAVGITPSHVLDMLTQGEVVIHKLTIPEGFTSKQIVELINAEPLLEGDIDILPKEGSLLPETYHFERGETKQQLVRRMQQDMQKTIQPLWQARQNGLPFNTIKEAIILASIVEKEARLAEERSHIASVYINRLHKGMKLQADPTTIYAIELEKNAPMDRPLLKKDLKRNLPHNTYMVEGLPPTPIANPGKASIEAVLNPKQTDDLFFVARGDGGHYFAKNYRQHQQNIAKYRASRQ